MVCATWLLYAVVCDQCVWLIWWKSSYSTCVSHPMWQYFGYVTFPSVPQSLILSFIHWFLLFGGDRDSKPWRVLLGQHSVVAYLPRMDCRIVKLLQQLFDPSWSEDKWQANPGEMLNLEKGTRKGTAQQIWQSKLHSACHSVQVWFLPSVDILWYLLLLSSFCTYFLLFSQPVAHDPISQGPFIFLSSILLRFYPCI